MTRDPARIDPILADLRRYWHAAPDLRLGQMVMGLLDLSGAPRYGEFHAEDDKVAAYLAAWAAANPPPPDHRDTPPPEIEAAIAAAAWTVAELDRRADVMAQPEIADLRTAITSALAAAREAGRREVLDVAAGVEEAINEYGAWERIADSEGNGAGAEDIAQGKADALRAAIAAEIRGARADAIAECKAASTLEVYPAAEDAIEAFRAATWSEALCSLNSDGAPTHVVQASIDAAGQALVDAWDSAQSGPPHRFAVYTDPEGDPEVAAGWMAMARMHAAAIAAARAVPADVEAAIDAYEARVTSLVTSMTGRAADDAAAVDVARNNLRAAIAADKAALDDTWRAHDLERDAEVAQAQAATHEACAALQAICAALHVAPPTGSTYCAGAVAMVLAALTGADAPKPTQCGAVDMLRGTICPTCGARKEFAPGPPTGEIRRQMDAAAVEMCADCAALTGAGGGR